MRDGIRLAADVYKPRQDGSYPAVLVRTPYGKLNPIYGYEALGELFSSMGYAVVIQDVRGKFRSEGDFYPIVNEGSDGVDTIRWVGAQPWCNGRVGMFGISYFAATDWLAAPLEHEFLSAVVPVFVSQNGYDAWLTGGVFHLSMTLTWERTAYPSASVRGSCARYRDSLENPSLLERGKIYRYEIDLGATSIVVAPGHCIRLYVSSSDFPRYDRNLNTGEPIGLSTRMETARQRIYHDAEHPTHLLLPLIPREED